MSDEAKDLIAAGLAALLLVVAALCLVLAAGCGLPPDAGETDPNAKCCECLGRTLDAPGGWCTDEAVCQPSDSGAFCLSLCAEHCGADNG